MWPLALAFIVIVIAPCTSSVRAPRRWARDASEATSEAPISQPYDAVIATMVAVCVFLFLMGMLSGGRAAGIAAEDNNALVCPVCRQA